LFAHNAFGKPRLSEDAANPDLRFNLAHSGGAALYAFAVGQEVGVDLELIRPDFATMTVARNFFAPEEVTALCALRGEDFVTSFYRCWTRKEAYVKAKGLGLSLPLSSFVVSVRPDDAPLLLIDRFDIRKQRQWMLRDVTVGEGFAAAVAVERQTKIQPRITEFKYPHVGLLLPSASRAMLQPTFQNR
jgi:4'-phosphopantetheinyl transferase